MDEALGATLAVIERLDRLGLPYLIGGSLASSLHGVPRSTRAADLAVDLPTERIDDLVAALAGSFYVDDEAARSAVRRKASFNVIHLATTGQSGLRAAVDGRHRHPLMADCVLVRRTFEC